MTAIEELLIEMLASRMAVSRRKAVSAINSPEFEKAGKYSWQNAVPKEMQGQWAKLSLGERAIAAWFGMNNTYH